MSEAEVEYVDGNTVHYKDVVIDHDNRILVFYENHRAIGFSPFEAILTLRWVVKEEKR